MMISYTFAGVTTATRVPVAFAEVVSSTPNCG